MMDWFADFMENGMGLQLPLQHVPGSSISLPPTAADLHSRANGHSSTETLPTESMTTHQQEGETRAKSMREVLMRDKRTPKLRKSCELCRDSKGKCVVPKEGRGCLSCIKERKTCVFLEAKPRLKRAKNSRIRVAEMEEKLNSLMALLEANNQKAQNIKNTQNQNHDIQSPNPTPNGHHTPSISSTTHPKSTSSSANTPSQTEPPAQATLSEHLDQICGFATPPQHQTHQHTRPPHSTPAPLDLSLQAPVHYTSSIFPFPDYVFNDLDDCISKGMISFESAEDSLKYFKTKSHTFPFVLYPDEAMGLDGMRRERPLLLLAILTSAQGRNRRVQEVLEGELKAELGRRVIMVGERSLDLLQGLLVYLAWYHMYIHPRNDQMYQFCQMAAGMAVDLNINHPDGDHNPLDMMTPLRSPKRPKTSSIDLEERRTFLGTYYMTASYCQGLRRASPIPLNYYGEECCQILSQVSVTETDYLIPYFIRLQKIADDINRTFDYDNHVSLPELDAPRIEILIKGFEEQFKQIEASFTEEIWRNRSIYLHEIGFHASPPCPCPPLKSCPSTASHSWYTSPLRTTHLLLSLQTSKQYLDKVLSLTSAQLEDFTLPALIRLVYAILIIGSLTMYFDAAGFDRGMARSIADVEVYLDGLIHMMEEGAKGLGEEGSLYMRRVASLFGHYKSRFLGMGMRETGVVPTRGYGYGANGQRGWEGNGNGSTNWNGHGHGNPTGAGTVGLLSFANMMPSDCMNTLPSANRGMGGVSVSAAGAAASTGVPVGMEIIDHWEGMLSTWEGASLGEEVMRGLDGIT
ncbi:hypothetical protein HYALB_00010751 [Hymenoscyphus albidus]|uniref:Zn(2)-C6 fungal-type domain-containing protein n=1 Tax=Hymenoscyphus albidus TaxID=595503 RepID=A0A9N9Q076_9HELO|nr:hypothetical protein HYALB_00010751 [Hymenoscyphus albidus]